MKSIDKAKMLNDTEIKDITDKIADTRAFHRVHRIYKPVDIKRSMAIIKVIGKLKVPNFKIDKYNEFTFKNLILWLHSSPNCECLDCHNNVIKADLAKGIYIYGNTGTGKTLALEILMAYSNYMDIQIQIDKDITRKFTWGNDRASDICRNFAQNGNYDRYLITTTLGIQDLGSEDRPTNYMGNKQNVMQNIIISRADDSDKITLVTSNIENRLIPLSELYGDRFASRMVYMSNTFTLGGVDRRIGINKLECGTLAAKSMPFNLKTK